MKTKNNNYKLSEILQGCTGYFIHNIYSGAYWGNIWNGTKKMQSIKYFIEEGDARTEMMVEEALSTPGWEIIPVNIFALEYGEGGNEKK